MHVVLAGGGTAGHTSPAARHRRRPAPARPGRRDHLPRHARGLETRLVPEGGYPLELIPPVPLPAQAHPDLLKVPGPAARRGHGGRAVLDRSGADVVVGFGGYVALPAYLAARRRKVPIVVHEPNAVPGLANGSAPGSPRRSR